MTSFPGAAIIKRMFSMFAFLGLGDFPDVGVRREVAPVAERGPDERFQLQQFDPQRHEWMSMELVSINDGLDDLPPIELPLILK